MKIDDSKDKKLLIQDTPLSDRTTQDESEVIALNRRIKDLEPLEKKEFIKKTIQYWLLQSKLEFIPYEIIKHFPRATNAFTFNSGNPLCWIPIILCLIIIVLSMYDRNRMYPRSFIILLAYPISFAFCLIEFQTILLFRNNDDSLEYYVSYIFGAIIASSFPALWSILVYFRRTKTFKLKFRKLLPLNILFFIIFRIITYFLQNQVRNKQYFISLGVGLILNLIYLSLMVRGLKRIANGRIPISQNQQQAAPMILALHMIK